MEPAFSGCLCLVVPSPVVGWQEIEAKQNFKNKILPQFFSGLHQTLAAQNNVCIRWFSFTSVYTNQSIQVVFFANRY